MACLSRSLTIWHNCKSGLRLVVSLFALAPFGCTSSSPRVTKASDPRTHTPRPPDVAQSQRVEKDWDEVHKALIQLIERSATAGKTPFRILQAGPEMLDEFKPARRIVLWNQAAIQLYRDVLPPDYAKWDNRTAPDRVDEDLQRRGFGKYHFNVVYEYWPGDDWTSAKARATADSAQREAEGAHVQDDRNYTRRCEDAQAKYKQAVDLLSAKGRVEDDSSPVLDAQAAGLFFDAAVAWEEMTAQVRFAADTARYNADVAHDNVGQFVSAGDAKEIWEAAVGTYHQASDSYSQDRYPEATRHWVQAQTLYLKLATALTRHEALSANCQRIAPDLWRQGESSYDREEWSDARSYYEKALKLITLNSDIAVHCGHDLMTQDGPPVDLKTAYANAYPVPGAAFQIENVGQRSLEFDVTPSSKLRCDPHKGIVPPGKVVVLRTEVLTDQVGSFMETLSIKSNAANTPALQIRLKLQVQERPNQGNYPPDVQ